MDSKNRKCNVNCCVYGFHSRKDREINLSFHRFPKARSGFAYITNKLEIIEKVDRLKAWELKLLMGKRPTSCLRVCSIHFIENDFILPEKKLRWFKFKFFKIKNIINIDRCSRRRSHFILYNRVVSLDKHGSTLREINLKARDILLKAVDFTN
ncbi:hypothetical protein RN001_009902 [Aquatica leii]|uniref:THAP-type domain-containing protein n=1 Tax=Aquatica leii TaxID=1421715 RepID=A0AAN7S8C2_9COLE|nr:hypothetical protein RN001_009902 [Aquatica leii]